MRRLLDEIGFNEPARARRRNVLTQFLLLFANPLVIILLITSIVSGRWVIPQRGDHRQHCARERRDQLRAVLSFDAPSNDSAKESRSRPPRCRDGAWIEVPRREIVPGDVVRLGAGDLVPADRGSWKRDLHVQQAR